MLTQENAMSKMRVLGVAIALEVVVLVGDPEGCPSAAADPLRLLMIHGIFKGKAYHGI
jgi:hypothetical protein